MRARRALGRLQARGHRCTARVLSWGPCGSSLGLGFPTWVSPADPGAPRAGSCPHGAPLLWAARRPMLWGGPRSIMGLGSCQPQAGSGRVLMERLAACVPPLLWLGDPGRWGPAGREPGDPVLAGRRVPPPPQVLGPGPQEPGLQPMGPWGAVREPSASPACPWECAGGTHGTGSAAWGGVRGQGRGPGDTEQVLGLARLAGPLCSIPAGLGSRPETSFTIVPAAGRSRCPALAFASQGQEVQGWAAHPAPPPGPHGCAGARVGGRSASLLPSVLQER